MHARPSPHTRRRASEPHLHSSIDDTELNNPPSYRQGSPAMRHRHRPKTLTSRDQKLNTPNPAMYTSTQIHQRTTRSQTSSEPKPNRNLRRSHDRHDADEPPQPKFTSTCTTHHNHHHGIHARSITIRRSTSPILRSMTRGESRSKPKKRSHSFSISRECSRNNCTLSNLHSKAVQGRLLLPPTHYSPSVTATQYSSSPTHDDAECSQSPDITPPPPLSLSLQANQHTKKTHSSHLRPRCNSISLSVSRSQPNMSTTTDAATRFVPLSSRLPQTCHVQKAARDEQKQANEDASFSNLDDIVSEKQFTLHYDVDLKPPRTYHADDSDDVYEHTRTHSDAAAADEELCASENRKALRKEIVAEQNIRLKSEPEATRVQLKRTPPRFTIGKGHHFKMDYGSSDGAFTLYKFMVTFHGQNERHESTSSQSQSSQQWSIKKRFSDFVTFHSNLVAEIKGMPVAASRVIKLPKVPPKTFTKNFSASFVSVRHDALHAYLSKLSNIRELQSSVALLTFLGAVTDHSSPTNHKFLHSRMTVSVYTSNYADSGDIILFETKSYLAAGLRSMTASHYDHVAFVFRDVRGTHRCHDDALARLTNDNDLFLVESTVDGVHTYPLKWRLRQWSLLCPQIVVRRLKLKPGHDRHASSSVHDLVNAAKHECLPAALDGKYAYDFVPKSTDFYAKVTEFVDKVNGSEYGIWSNVLRLNDVPFEKQKSFFCSQLVTAFLKFVDLLPENVKTHRMLPGHFSDDASNTVKHLPLQNCVLSCEHLLLFNLPAVSTARPKQYTTNKCVE